MKALDAETRRHLRPARRSLVVLVGAQATQAIATVAQAFAVAGAVQALVRHDSVRGWATAIIATTLVRSLVAGIAEWSSATAASMVAIDLRTRLMQRMSESGPDRVRMSTGHAVLAVIRGVGETKPYLTRYLPAVVLTTVVPPIVLLAVLVVDPLSALVVVVTLPLVPVFGALVGLHTRDRAERQWRQLGSLAGHFVDVMRGLPTLVAFRRAERQVEVIRSTTHRYRRTTMATLRLAFASSMVLELVATLSVALVAVSVGLRLAAGHLDLRTGLFVLVLAPEAYLPFRRAGAEFHAAATGRQAFQDASRLLASAPSSLDAAPRRGRPWPTPRSIRMAAVTVRWPGSPYAALNQIRADLPPTGLVAVRGPSGAGKTTVLDVLRGQVRPSAGTVLVDGLDLQGLDRVEWRNQVAFLPQNPVFVAGSIADNLRLARPDAHDVNLWETLNQVGLAAKVRSLPQGLDSRVEEDARNFSAGERARLAMARIVVAGRPVLLLDEPTAHLDRETEHDLAGLVNQLAESTLVVVATHSDALARAADLVVLLRARSDGEAMDPPEAEPLPPVAAATAPPRSNVDRSDDEMIPARGRLRSLVAIMLGVLAAVSGIALTATAGWLIVEASQRPPVLTLMVAIVAVRTFGLARPCLRYVERLWSHDVALRRLAEIRAELFASLIPLTPGRLGRRRGEVLDELVDDAEAYVDRQLRVWFPLAVLGGTSCVVLMALFLLSPGQPGIIAVVAGLVGVATAVGTGLRLVLGRGVGRIGVARRRLTDAVTRLVEQRDELATWDAQGRSLAETDRASRELERQLRHEQTATAAGRATILAATGAAVAATLGLAAGPVSAQVLGPGWAGLLVLVPLALGELLQGVPELASLEVSTREALQRIDHVVRHRPQVVEPAKPRSLEHAADLTLSGVSAGWGDRVAFRDLDARWRTGLRVGVCGRSGSGKSTLAAVVVRYLDPRNGQVRLGPVPLDQAALDDVRQRLLMLDDSPHLFATTVAANLRIADPGASDDHLVDTIKQAGLAQWLDELPDGLDTMVGEGHRSVSGGELTRLAVARALLAESDVLVLDEPTAHLDAPLARRVTKALMASARDRTIVLLSHRETDLAACDERVELRAPEVESTDAIRSAAAVPVAG